jgi:hypothetical protein
MALVDDLIKVSNDKFKYKDPEELRPYYDKAIKEHRILYLRNNGDVVGYLIYYLFDKEGLEKYLKDNIPEHNPRGKYLYIDENVVFTGKKANYLYLRKEFKEMYPQIKSVCWDNIVTKGGKRKRRLFKYTEEDKL